VEYMHGGVSLIHIFPRICFRGNMHFPSLYYLFTTCV